MSDRMTSTTEISTSLVSVTAKRKDRRKAEEKTRISTSLVNIIPGQCDRGRIALVCKVHRYHKHSHERLEKDRIVVETQS